MCIFISTYENIKLQRISLKNLSKENKKVNISYSIDPVLGVVKDVNRNYVLCKEAKNSLEFKNPYSLEFSDCIAYITVLGKSKDMNVKYVSDEYKVIVEVELQKDEEAEFTIILGCTEKLEDINRIQNMFESTDSIKREYDNTVNYWRKLSSKKYET